jgi:hypothetical protein
VKAKVLAPEPKHWNGTAVSVALVHTRERSHVFLRWFCIKWEISVFINNEKTQKVRTQNLLPLLTLLRLPLAVYLR